MDGKGFRILNVEVENFRGYEGKLVYDFPKDSKVFLFSGPNGYGKTTFFDSIEWVLTGKISRISENIEVKKDRRNPTEQSVINNMSNKNKSKYANVTMKFLLDNMEYEIKRESNTYNKDYLKENTTLSLKIKEDFKEISGEWIDSLFKEKQLNSYRLTEKFSSYHLCSHEKNLKILQKNRESLHSMLSVLFGENKFSLYRDNIKKLSDGVIVKIKDKQEEYKLLYDSGKEVLNNKNTSFFKQYLDNYNSWLLPNELKITYDNFLEIDLYEKKNVLMEILNILKYNEKYLNYKRYLSYKNKENEYQLFLREIENSYIETKEIIEDKNFSFDKLELERRELFFFKENIEKLKNDILLRTHKKEEGYINLLHEFLMKHEYDLKETNFNDILEFYYLSEKLYELRTIVDSEEKERLQFEEKNLYFINFLSYAQKHIESNHTSNNCPLCNQEIPLETLKQIIEHNQNIFTKADNNLAKLKDEYTHIEKKTVTFMEKFKRELELILNFIDKKLELYSNTLQKRIKIQRLEHNLSRYQLSIDEINEKLINKLKEEYHIEIEESLKLVNQNEVITDSLEYVKDYISKYEEKLSEYKDILREVDLEKIQLKLDNLEKIIDNNNYLLFKKKIDKISNELDELRRKQKLITKIKNNINLAVNKTEKKYKNELEEPINYVYRKINRHSNFSAINISLPSGTTNKKVDTTVGNEGNTVNLSNVLSSGQITTVALSFFLGIAFKKRFSKFNVYFFDDPIQHMDDLNILSFIDLLRVHLREEDFANQVFISTCNEDIDSLLVSKMKHFKIGITKFNFKNYGEFEKVAYPVL
ncbi:AAA family ATPase [Bacillus sp. 123MFChir2]|uniref:AAA family ATPase n=1 Tax=Bacillus sp. 123MFChir2 TaxID=1169144 RepID=UPI00035DA078|nr:AAA family ATPase [Bacillus sp. 123MFChir2]